jgi:two-component system, NarL family, sensor kinase
MGEPVRRPLPAPPPSFLPSDRRGSRGALFSSGAPRLTVSPTAIAFVIVTSTIAFVFGWITYLRVQLRTLRDRLAAREAKLRDYAAGLLRAEEEERARVSRELHDGVGQLIAAVNLELETVRAEAPEALQPRIDDLRTLATQIGGDLRRMAHELRPAILDELGLHDALTELTRRMSRPPRSTPGLPAGLTITLAVRGNLVVLPPDLRLCCYRVAQEALTNVVKHSGASRAEVHVDLDGHALRLAISDNGKGLPEAPRSGDGAQEPTGIGLLSLRERVEAVGGSLHLSKAELGGALVAAELPVA